MSDIELLSEQDEVVPQGFTVDTLEKAEWCLRTKGKAQAEIDRFTAMADKLKADFCAKIDARLEQILKPHRNTMEVMTEFIRPWANVEVAKAGGKKSVKLLNGTVGFRQSPARLEVTDEAAAIAWLEKGNAEQCIRVKEEVDKKATKAFIEQTGVVPDGCELVSGEVKFYADPEPLKLDRR